MRYLVVALLLFAGCMSASQGIRPEVAETIPEGANVVLVYSDRPPAELYRSLHQLLVDRGFEVAQEDPTQLTVTTDFRQVARATNLKVMAAVRQDPRGSAGVLRGEWRVPGSYGTGQSVYTGVNVETGAGQRAAWLERDRAGVAFGKLAELAADLDGVTVEYFAE